MDASAGNTFDLRISDRRAKARAPTSVQRTATYIHIAAVVSDDLHQVVGGIRYARDCAVIDAGFCIGVCARQRERAGE